MNRLNISNASLAGLVGDVDAGITCDVVSHGTLLSHLKGSQSGLESGSPRRSCGTAAP